MDIQRICEASKGFVNELATLSATGNIVPLLTPENVNVSEQPPSISLKNKNVNDPNLRLMIYPGYSAPEIYQNRPGLASPVYFVGAVMYTLLTKGTPPDAQSRFGQNAPLLQGSSPLENVINRATDLNEAARIPNLNQLWQELNAAGMALAPAPAPAAPVYAQPVPQPMAQPAPAPAPAVPAAPVAPVAQQPAPAPVAPPAPAPAAPVAPPPPAAAPVVEAQAPAPSAPTATPEPAKAEEKKDPAAVDVKPAEETPAAPKAPEAAAEKPAEPKAPEAVAQKPAEAPAAPPAPEAKPEQPAPQAAVYAPATAPSAPAAQGTPYTPPVQNAAPQVQTPPPAPVQLQQNGFAQPGPYGQQPAPGQPGQPMQQNAFGAQPPMAGQPGQPPMAGQMPGQPPMQGQQPMPGQPPIAGQPQPKKKKKSMKGLIIAAAIVVVLVAAGVIYTVVQGNSAETAFAAGDYPKVVQAINMTPWIKGGNQEIYDYSRARVLMDEGSNDEALEILEGLGAFEDSADLAKGIKYDKAVGLLDAGSLSESLALFKEVRGYEDSSYYIDQIELYMEAETMPDVLDQYYAYRDLGEFLDSAEKADALAGSMYDAGLVHYNAGEFSDALSYFNPISDYNDAALYAEASQIAVDAIGENANSNREAYARLVVLAESIDVKAIFMQDGFLPLFLEGSWSSGDGGGTFEFQWGASSSSRLFQFSDHFDTSGGSFVFSNGAIRTVTALGTPGTPLASFEIVSMNEIKITFSTGGTYTYTR